MANIILVANIVISYIIWATFTKLLYDRIKNKLIFVVLTLTIYSLIPLYYVLIYNKVIVALLIIPVYILALWIRGGDSFLKTVLIPLPIIVMSMYLLLV